VSDSKKKVVQSEEIYQKKRLFQEKNIGMPIATTAPQPLPEAKKRLIGFGKRERHG
jgi:hypothetical protein